MKSLNVASCWRGVTVARRLSCLVACVSLLLFSACGPNYHDRPGVLLVADAVTLERVAEVQIEFATTQGLANRSADQFLDGVSTHIGMTGPNGCVEVPVWSRTDPSTVFSSMVGSLFDRLWIVRVTKDGYSETIIIETSGSAVPSPAPDMYEGEGERYVVTGFMKPGAFPDVAAQICAEGME